MYCKSLVLRILCIQIKYVTSRRRDELDEEVLTSANDGVWKLAHAAEHSDNGTRRVLAVVDFYVVVRTMLSPWK